MFSKTTLTQDTKLATALPITYSIQYWKTYEQEKSITNNTLKLLKTLSVSLFFLHWGSRASVVAQTVKNLPVMREDLGSIPRLGRSPGGGPGNPLQYSCLENPHGQRSLAGYRLWSQSQTQLRNWAQHHTGDPSSRSQILEPWPLQWKLGV